MNAATAAALDAVDREIAANLAALPRRRRQRTFRSLEEAMAYNFAPAYDPSTVGVVYQLHFDRPYVAVSGKRKKTVTHYTGFTTLRTFARRLAQHLAGYGARLLQVITEAGIGFSVSRLWLFVRQSWERIVKQRGHAALLCPRCSGPDAWHRAVPPAWILAQGAAHAA